MILSASRRTDIPCYYSQWFMNRIRAGDGSPLKAAETATCLLHHMTLFENYINQVVSKSDFEYFTAYYDTEDQKRGSELRFVLSASIEHIRSHPFRNRKSDLLFYEQVAYVMIFVRFYSEGSISVVDNLFCAHRFYKGGKRLLGKIVEVHPSGAEIVISAGSNSVVYLKATNASTHFFVFSEGIFTLKPLYIVV